MKYLHRCVFCGDWREAVSATIAPPHCGRCGCLLVSEPAEARRVAAPSVLDARPQGPLARALGLGASLAVMLSAAAAGWNLAGGWVGLGAFAAAGLAMLPFLAPEG